MSEGGTPTTKLVRAITSTPARRRNRAAESVPPLKEYEPSRADAVVAFIGTQITERSISHLIVLSGVFSESIVGLSSAKFSGISVGKAIDGRVSRRR